MLNMANITIVTIENTKKALDPPAVPPPFAPLPPIGQYVLPPLAPLRPIGEVKLPINVDLGPRRSDPNESVEPLEFYDALEVLETSVLRIAPPVITSRRRNRLRDYRDDTNKLFQSRLGRRR